MAKFVRWARVTGDGGRRWRGNTTKKKAIKREVKSWKRKGNQAVRYRYCNRTGKQL